MLSQKTVVHQHQKPKTMKKMFGNDWDAKWYLQIRKYSKRNLNFVHLTVLKIILTNTQGKENI